MKLATFIPDADVPGGPRVGALTDDGRSLVDLAAAAAASDGGSAPPELVDMLALLDAGPRGLELATEAAAFAAEQDPPDVRHPLDAVSLMAPVPRPRSIRDCLLFEKHLRQATRTAFRWRIAPLANLDEWAERRLHRKVIPIAKVWYEQPIYYKSNPFSVVGPEAEVRWPSYTERLDYELEFGIFIGRTGVNIPASRARDHIAGYTIFNDFSARDAQLREMPGRLGPAKGKDFDTGNAMGPWLVTPDEVPDPYALTMLGRINGEEWSRGSSAGMQHSFEEVIEHISRDETLHPGEFIGSGTVGNGCGLELDRWLRPGDTVELEVDGLGVLRNRVVRPGA